MDENVKKDIAKVEETLSTDDELLSYYGSEEDFRRLQQGKLKNAEKKATQRGFEKGLKDGLEQGIEQGTKKNTIEIAKNMLNSDFDINVISKITGLTLEEINDLK